MAGRQVLLRRLLVVDELAIMGVECVGKVHTQVADVVRVRATGINCGPCASG